MISLRRAKPSPFAAPSNFTVLRLSPGCGTTTTSSLSGLAIMTAPSNNTSGIGKRRSMLRQAARLEGLVVQKRFAGVEQPRYLVIDFLKGSIAVYKRPPPKDDVSLAPKRERSVPSKLMSSMTRFMNSRSLSLDSVVTSDGGKSQVAFEHLAHMEKQPIYKSDGTWDPIFTVPPGVQWKIR